jgi:hypothetical protein
MALVIMVAYYVLCAYLAGLLFWSFLREKRSREELWLCLLVMVPLVLRLLRVK